MKLDNICNQVYVVAVNEARIQHHEYVTPEHFLYAALMFEAGKSIILKSGGNLAAIQKDMQSFFESHMPSHVTDSPVDSFEFVRMFELASAQAHVSGSPVVILGNILVAIFSLPHSFAAHSMRENGVNRFALLKVISQEIGRMQQRTAQEHQEKTQTSLHKTQSQGQGQEMGEPVEEGDKETFLTKYTVELTQKAAEGTLDPLVGREGILQRTMQVLCRRLKNNPVHVGEPGVGKTSIVEGLAQRIVAGENVPASLQDAKIYMVDLGLVVAGTKYRGDFEERLIKLMNIIAGLPNPIVYLDEIHTAVGAGAVSGGSMDATSIIKPYLAKGHIKFIGSTTFDEYKKHFEKDRALSRRFQRIDVPEPTVPECVDILKGLRHKYENFHRVVYPDSLLNLISTLAAKYVQERFLPDKAIDLMDETGAFLRMNNPEADTLSATVQDIERTVALMAKVPEKTVTATESEKLKDLAFHLSEQVFGQEEAVETVTSAIKAARSGLNDQEKPIASLLFVGPTGVGKTELAKQLAGQLGVKLLRYDMSEYQEKHSVARLIGSPPGYVGYEEGGLLTEAVNKAPHCVLLLDEIEKAHGDIYNVLLQMMDYGTLTDNTGKKADFRNVVLIMTSNAGAKDIGRRVIGYADKTWDTDAITKEVERIFAPEFRNRLDDVVIFRHVDEAMAKRIVEKSLSRLEVRLKEKGVNIKATEAALAHIAEKGLSHQFGAREIIRVVEKDIKKQLVDVVLFGPLAQGGTATVDYQKGKLCIRTRAKAKRKEKEPANV